MYMLVTTFEGYCMYVHNYQDQYKAIKSFIHSKIGFIHYVLSIT